MLGGGSRHSSSNTQTLTSNNHEERKARILTDDLANNLDNNALFIQKSKPPVNHPLTNAPGAPSKINQGISNDPRSFYERCWHNVLAFRWLSIAGSSKTTYKSGWNKWIPFTQKLGSNANLTIIPHEWVSRPIPPLTFLECAISCFMANLEDEGLQPKTIFTYVFGVLFFLKNMNIDVTPVSFSKFVKSIKSGISRNARLQDNDLHCEANRGKNLPLTVFMLVDIRSRVLTNTNSYHICLCCAIHAAFIYLFRSNEFLLISDSDGYFHFLREQDVRFSILDEGRERLIPSSEAHKYADRFKANKHSVLIDVQLNVRHAKNDPEGIGNRFIHEIEKPEENRAFCIVWRVLHLVAVRRSKILS